MEPEEKRPRFASHSEGEMKKMENIYRKNTRKANESCQRMIEEYMGEKGVEGRFVELEKQQMNDLLSKFYLDARDNNGEVYHSNTLNHIRYALRREVMETTPEVDIIRNSSFAEANKLYEASKVQSKVNNRGITIHYPTIEDEDVAALYANWDNEDPMQLSEKVQFEIRLYFCRRGRQNMHEMTADTFAVKTNASGRKCIMYFFSN